MFKRRILYFLNLSLILTFFISCSNVVLPKPKAFLQLNYPTASYKKIEGTCPFFFEISQESTIDFNNNCWATIKYSKMNATIHLTYRKVEGNLDAVIQEVEKLTYEHTIKADAINRPKEYANNLKKVYGEMVKIEGDVASNIQFHVTDSVKNVLYGALYFNVKPNYDSILPAINYIEKDIKNLMESVEWR